ncbi:hypothetical protein P691DRAFT_767148 [Macrolepiota fuliginosa MF-IS2]|uniref:HAT C-terminal dimerisation domain-containing protein n=1 Tax=Macrolepiota fuliginosa MF-IS2 TaxID=1400762 RepID=A0A9P5WZL7_9AGAR|nr:hypothetical protein P691DRAFT_767148 [Macrolepiota fuliginosa MF-IS2]
MSAVIPESFHTDIQDYLLKKGQFQDISEAVKMEIGDARSQKCSLDPFLMYQYLGFGMMTESPFTIFTKCILSITGNSASCKRLFSAFGTILT